MRHQTQKTIANLKRYDLKTVIYNLEKAWKQVPPSTLTNAWNPLLQVHEDMREVFGRFDQGAREVNEALGDDEAVTEEDILKWITVDEGNPGLVLRSIKQIAEEVMH